tara:strand:+ start:14 stop:1246 length:1233 start_codon:yes stop_codon:yes gene_type:complete
MANQVEKLNTIAIADIEKINTLTDDNIEKINTLEFTSAPATAGALFRSGYNTQGEVGDGTTVIRRGMNPNFVQIGSGTDWVWNSGSGQSTNTSGIGYGVKADGTAWIWGAAEYGKLGNETTSPNICSPIQVGSLTDWKQMNGGQYHSMGVKTDGTLWAWGRNNFGQLGLGNTTDYSSPVQVGSLTDWDYVVCSFGTTSCLKTDGTVWGFGQGWYGSMGQGNETDYSSPVQLGSYTDWTYIGRTVNAAPDFMGVRGGKLWGCGANSYGGLGTGNTTSYNSPVQIGSLTNWSTVEGGSAGFCSIKTDGTAWAWGLAYQGMNMDGTDTNTSSPVQIGSLTDWSSIKKAARYLTMAIKTDGTFWAAGVNTPICGSLAAARSSPIQIGSSTAWKSIGSSQGTTSMGIIGDGPVCS